jgi:LysR family glycine cleavage system transcriptional activator
LRPYRSCTIGSGSKLPTDLFPRLGIAEQINVKVMAVACVQPGTLAKRPVQTVDDLRDHVMLHSATTRSAWSQWLAAAGAADLKAVRQLELEHVYLQLQAAAEGLGVALASVPLIEADVAAGRLVCPIPAPMWHAGDYELVTNEERIGIPVVRAFRDWIRTMVHAATPHGSQ